MEATKIDVIHDYVHVFNTSLDTKTLRKGCLAMALDATRRWGDVGGAYDDANAPESTKIYNHYNALLHPHEGFIDVYKTICDAFSQIKAPGNTDNYWVQAWVNVYKKGSFVSWHNHFPTTLNAYHGFLCVNCGDSKTTYAIEEGDTIHECHVKSEDGLLVISKSSNDKHRTYPWEDAENPRITLAFDIVPEWAVQQYNGNNHWMPVV